MQGGTYPVSLPLLLQRVGRLLGFDQIRRDFQRLLVGIEGFGDMPAGAENFSRSGLSPHQERFSAPAGRHRGLRGHAWLAPASGRVRNILERWAAVPPSVKERRSPRDRKSV